MKKAYILTRAGTLVHTQTHTHIKAGRRISLCLLRHTHAHTCNHWQTVFQEVIHSALLLQTFCPSQRSQPRTSAIHANPGSAPAECHRFSATSASFTSHCSTDSTLLSAYWWELSWWRWRQITVGKQWYEGVCIIRLWTPIWSKSVKHSLDPAPPV